MAPRRRRGAAEESKAGESSPKPKKAVQRRRQRPKAPDEATAQDQIKGKMAQVQPSEPKDREIAKQQTIQLYVDQVDDVTAACRAYNKRTAPMLRILVDLGLRALQEQYREKMGHEIPPVIEPPEIG